MKIALMADSSSGISQAEANELGVYIAPVPVFINNEYSMKIRRFRKSSFTKK